MSYDYTQNTHLVTFYEDDMSFSVGARAAVDKSRTNLA
jgi:hypothetical protein